MNPASSDRQIDYIELPVADLPKTKQFYEAVFGWAWTDYGDAYSSFHDGRLSGGLTADEAEKPKGPLVVLYAVNLEETLDRLTAAGGIITRSPFAFPGGRRFHFTDPAGNELAVWSES